MVTPNPPVVGLDFLPPNSLACIVVGEHDEFPTAVSFARRPIGAGEALVRAFAEAEGLETKAGFRFPVVGEKDVPIDPLKLGRIVSRTGRKLDSRAKTCEGLKQASERSATF